MDAKVIKELSEDAYTPFHLQLLTDTKALIDQSRRHMQLQYDKWDQSVRTFDLFYHLDQQDRKARERKEPEKQIFPLSYAQQMTFIAFCFALFTQRERIFELEGNNLESQKPAKLAEALLSRDLAHNSFEIKLYQFLLDITRFGIGIFNTSWTKETQRCRVRQQGQPLNFMGVQIPLPPQEVEQIVTKYLGNKIVNVSPYRFYPDTRLPLVRFQEGEFCGSEDEYSYVALKQMEKDGLITGTKWLKPFTKKMLMDRGQSRFSDDVNVIDSDISTHSGQTKGSFVLTEVERVIVPNEYMINGNPLGEEDYPQKWLFAYVNDTRIVRAEPLNYLHDQFTYDVGQFSPDILHLLSQSLSGTIDGLQSIVSWFINARITNVRKVISDKLIVDPSGVEMKDLADRNPIIRLLPAAAGRGVDQFVKQLDLQDVTVNHLKDVEFLKDFTQVTTGINDNILGQFYTGRRSATEARNVNSSAAARLKMLASLFFGQCLTPMAQKMVSNLRDGLDEETLVKLAGVDEVMDAQGFQTVTRDDLVGSYDFEIFDGTLPSEKALIAQVLETVLQEFMKNPQLGIAMQIDPRALLIEAMKLRGVRNPSRFMLAPPPGQPGQPGGQSQLPGPPQPQGQPIQPGAPMVQPPIGGWARPLGEPTSSNQVSGLSPAGASHGIQDLIKG